MKSMMNWYEQIMMMHSDGCCCSLNCDGIVVDDERVGDDFAVVDVGWQRRMKMIGVVLYFVVVKLLLVMLGQHHRSVS